MIEFDGDGKYDGPQGRVRLRNEKRREDELRSWGCGAFGMAGTIWTAMSFFVAGWNAQSASLNKLNLAPSYALARKARRVPRNSRRNP